MAFKMNVPLPGGIEHADGYVRVTDVRVCKKDDADNWFMMVDVAVYKDADARGVASPARLVAPDVRQFTFAHGVNDSVTPAAAYAKLKTHDTFKGKTTDV
jgi:hypothetical protein